LTESFNVTPHCYFFFFTTTSTTFLSTLSLHDALPIYFIQRNSHLKIIANNAVGYDNIDIDAAEKQQIIVTNTPDVLTHTTADLTFALLMVTARRIIEAHQVIQNNE